MNKPHRRRLKDASSLRTRAARAGRRTARRGTSGAGEAVVDSFSTGAHASARASAVFNLAAHLQHVRPKLDRRVAEVVGPVVRRTALVGDLLFRTSAADHEAQAFKQLPLAARREPWPAWLRCFLLGILAVGTGGALSGALLELTSDDPSYVWGFCLAVTLAVVALGAFLAHMARSFEYNHLKAGQFSTGWLPKVIFGIGASFAVLLVVALASIRGTAAEADAARQSRADDDAITVVLPDQPVVPESRVAPEEQSPLPSVPALAFGILEGLLFMTAFGVEYANYLPWADQRRRAEAALGAVERELQTATGKLAEACGRLMAHLNERATQDASVLLVGESALIHVAAEVSDYQRAVLVRQSAQDGEQGLVPIPDSNPSVAAEVEALWGRDLMPAGLTSPEAAYDHLEVDQFAPTALARGLAMLARTPERARFSSLTWDPGALVTGTGGPVPRPIGVKPTGSNGGRTTDSSMGNGVKA